MSELKFERQAPKQSDSVGSIVSLPSFIYKQHGGPEVRREPDTKKVIGSA